MAHALITLLATAHTVGKLSRPVVKIRTAEGVWKFSYVTKAQRAENNGGCYINVGDLYVGWLSPRNTKEVRWMWDIKNELKGHVEAMLLSLDRPDLKDHLAALGRDSGCCCFCGLELTNEGSVHYGYGPICASRWGLPWSDHYDGDAQAIVDAPVPEDF